MTVFDIKITSDPVCPWCYIGYRRLQKGIEIFQKVYPGAKNDTFTIRWAPYYLDPTAPTDSIPLEDRMASKMGVENIQKVKELLVRMGTAEGMDFKFGSRTGSTRDCHRMIAMAGKKGPEFQGKVAEEIFRGYFEEEQDITSHEFLVQAAKTAGLDEDAVRAGLRADECGKEVDEEAEAAKLNGVRGVPSFNVNMQRDIGGAQDASEWMEIFTAIKEAEAAA